MHFALSLSSAFSSLSALKNLLTGDIPPSRVVDKNLETISNYNVLQRDDSMVLYAPPLQPDGTSKAKLCFEIVLYRPVSETVNAYR
jgi:aspartate carbamoyltransferase catalytic subunit